MVAYKKKITKKAYPSKKGYAKKAVVKAKTQRLTKFVKKVISRQEEKKVISFTDDVDVGAYTNITNIQNNIMPITPYAVTGVSIAQGVGQDQRIGNRIRTKSCWIRGVLLPNPYSATVNVIPTPQEIRVWFFSRKDSIVQPTSLPSFLQNGSGSGSPVGTVIDMTRMINSDAYVYRGHRTYKLGFSNYGGTGTTVTQQSFTNNDFKFNVKFNINVTSMLPKQITYNDSDNTPYSKSVFMYWESVDADGSVQPATNLPSRLIYTTTFTYTDA